MGVEGEGKGEPGVATPSIGAELSSLISASTKGQETASGGWGVGVGWAWGGGRGGGGRGPALLSIDSSLLRISRGVVAITTPSTTTKRTSGKTRYN